VEFLAVAEVGRNPARIIPAWQDWVARNAGRGAAFRGIGEVVWVGRTELEIRECRIHEHLLNIAFGAGPGWTLLCPYDAAQLPRPVIDSVAGSHPAMLGARATEQSAAFDARAGLDAFAVPSPELGAPLFEASFGLEDLPRLRAAVRERAGPLGLHGRLVEDLVLVADELASNSVGVVAADWRCGRATGTRCARCAIEA
jgi:hypothetical protein